MTDEPTHGPTDPEDQHDPDGDSEMLTSKTTQPDQAEGEDDATETKDDEGSDR